MPRLLLVDDNPSIHRIAESLLAPTDVELVCVDSAAEALDRFARGEHFDVALVDTTMPGMDGWTLLARLREMEATAHLPIALMAGVLDPVDPARLAKAPIQGFLKKPIELRELGDRVKVLLATPPAAAPAPASLPVPEPTPMPLPVQAPAFATTPAPLSAMLAAAPAMDLARTAEVSLPGAHAEAPPAEEAPILSLDLGPEPTHSSPEAPAPEEDLLLLTAEDLWPEETPETLAVPQAAAAPEVHLDLEELDFDSLHGLTAEALPAALVQPAPPVEAQAAPPVASHPAPPEPAIAVPAAEALAEESLSFSGLESFDDLEGGLELPPLPEAPAPAAAPSVIPGAIGVAAVAGLAAAALPLAGKHPEPHALPAEEAPAAPAPVMQAPAVFHEPPVPAPALAPTLAPALAAALSAPAAPGQAPAAPGQAAFTPEQIQALLADPAVVDALVKAVVARMGDQVVREIAWEVMPELAGRLQR